MGYKRKAERPVKMLAKPRIRAIALVLLGMLFTVLAAGCRQRSEPAEKGATAANGLPLVVCTTTMITDLAEQLGQERIKVVGIIQPGMDPHSYEPTPSDVIWFKKADLVLFNGLHLEGRMLDMIESAGSTAVALAEDERIQLRGKAGAEGAPDPHCWWNARYFMVYAERARDALVRIDPAGAEVYRTQAAGYLKQLEQADARVRQAVTRIAAPQRVLITSHDAFFYYGDAYGLKVDAVLGISTDAEVRALRAAELAQMVVAGGVPAVFHETSVSAALNQMVNRVVEIAISKGHQVRVAEEPLYSDSLGAPGTPADTYLGAFQENTRIIVEALSGQPAPEPDHAPESD